VWICTRAIAAGVETGATVPSLGALTGGEIAGIAIALAAGVAIGLWVRVIRTGHRMAGTAQELEEEQQRRADFLASTTELVLFADPQEKLVSLNAAGRELLGWSATEEVRGRWALDMLTDEDRQRWINEVRPAMRRDNRWHGRVELSRRDGARVPVEVTAIAHRHADGSTWFYSAIARDLRAQEHAETERARFLGFLEATPEFVLFADSERRLTYVNPAGRRLVGLGPQSRIEGLEAKSFLSPAARLAWDETVRPAVLTTGSWSGESTLLAPDGELIPVDLWVNAHRDGNEQRSFFSVVGRDLRERQRHERERSELEHQLTQAQKLDALGTLAGGVAHDFNNILTAILGNTEILTGALSPASPLGQAAQQIFAASQRARDLVKQILTFSRRGEKVRGVVRLRPVVEETMALLRASLPSTIELQTLIQDVPPVLGDPSQVHQVVLNLCTNAAQALPEQRGFIEVRLDLVRLPEQGIGPETDALVGPHVRLTVTDNGCGISPDLLERIFEPFFTTKMPGQGTGLGLAVVHGIVERHDGVIGVRSVADQGTTFFVWLPATQETVTSPATPEAAPQLPHGSGERILVIDDEAAVAGIARVLLMRFGYQPECLTSPREALALFRTRPHDFAAVLTDLTMPSLTGREVRAAIHEVNPRTPVILMTGYSGSLSRAEIRKLGFADLLNKPFLADALLGTVAEVLRENAAPAPAINPSAVAAANTSPASPAGSAAGS
jgi:PAS domain S-box-containing protein